PPPRATATPVPTAATAPDSSSSSQSHPRDESATPTALPTAAAPPPPNASATPVPLPTAAESAQLRLLPRKPRAAIRSTCRDRFMRMLLSERMNLHALDNTTGGGHARAADTAFSSSDCPGWIRQHGHECKSGGKGDQSVEGLDGGKGINRERERPSRRHSSDVPPNLSSCVSSPG